ncbi:hypothetical protein Pse7367_2352 [Thalassoporum mexicanum PCC 7367]|uniref:nitrate reductase associated protein n=1 Tax=Thalassoporum mexicanum TaxID=3457544 RepID=UPI00029FAE5D|nr:nitrate reductase associated protein [Pseudanabaena sp. PCC 7367]AFY70613.1 hypothetical protein Pse7367_2352 [Pseudanabaena sp. PCC 7367]
MMSHPPIEESLNPEAQTICPGHNIHNQNPTTFDFEADFIKSLRCIPMQVRYKLDTCGIKLKLQHWHSLSHTDRQQLTNLPCESSQQIYAYREKLCALVIASGCDRPKDLPIDPMPDWLNTNRVPEVVIHKAQTLDLEINLNQWKQLSPLQRFALIKLSRSGHENRNFLPAATEFGLVLAE